ncbi:mitogen-activated protein kinase-binding protein 1-like isoform X2 [Littorina saxatilis]|uniref:mitogen-activated protein kinase-binding protein 1-like isoform X2 n=1 Tax=Littorina saxatilis TaxID=31220 RepID=UPI0038B5F6BA
MLKRCPSTTVVGTGAPRKLTLERVLGLTVSSNAAFSCDPVNGTIAYPAGCVVVLFNPRRNRQSHIFNVSKKTITSLAFSADGKHLVTGECGHQPAVRVWDVEEKTQVAEFHGHKFGINCVAFSPQQKYLVSVGSQHDMMVNVWNWRTGNKVSSNKVSSKVSKVAFLSDGSSFVTVGNRHVKFWYLDISKSKINQTVPLSGRSGILGDQKNNFFCDVVCGRGPATGSIFVITQSGLLCEFNEKRLLDKWVELRTKSANCITAGEDHIYVGCAEGVVRVFSSTSLHFITSLPHPHHLGVDVATATSSSDLICTQTDATYPDVMAITLDDDHKKVACIYNDHSLYVWDVLNVRRVGKAWSFLFHSGCVWALEIYPRLENKQTGVLPAGSFLTGSSDDTIRVWNLDPQMTETPGYKHNIYSSELLKVVYTEPSRTYLCDVNYNPAGATDKTDTNWDGKNGVRSIRVSPDGEHLASGDRQGNVRIYDLHQMSEIRSIEAHESDVVCLEYSFSKAGPKILATGSRDRLIHVFDVEQRYGLLQTLDDHSAAIQSVRFTDANNKLRMLSCGSDKSILFRNASLNPGFEFSLDQHLVSKATMYDMIVDPTQKFVATACQDRNVRVYNMATAKQKKNYRASLGDEGTLLRIQLDPSGTYAATSCTDKNVCVLEFYTGELTASVFGHSEITTGLRFTNDLKHLISVSADSCIFVWRLPSDMTKTMRLRMEELGKMPQGESSMSDLRREGSLIPNPVSLDGTFTTSSSSHFPVMKENISPARILSSMTHSSSDSGGAFPTTPVGKRGDASISQPSPAGVRFSMGPLPKWAKAQFGEGGDGTDGGADSIQPKGRWAQRYDQNVAFKSQLDLTQLDDDSDQRRKTGFESSGLSLKGGELSSCTSMPDLRRETVVLSQATPPKNIPIIDDDDETNIDDDEDFFPAYMKSRLPGPATESDRSSSDHDDRRRMRKSEPMGGKSEGPGRRWGSRVSLGVDDKTSSFDLDDADDLDTWSDTTEVIYPPSDSESVDTYASTYRVFAVEGDKKVHSKRTSQIPDDESESTDQVSLEDQGEDDPNDETLVTSNASTPCDHDRDFMPGTPDKEQFVKENFESVSFTPMAMDKFAQQVATLERAVEDDPSNMPFSPRLSLSSKFLSRSQFGGIRGGGGGGLGGGQRADNWFDPLRRNKSDMARAMDDTRRRLADMNWRTGGLLQESPEKEDPPSPPTRLDNREPSFSTPKAGHTNSNPGGKLEKDTSPIPPASPTRTTPSSPGRGSSPLAGKDKRHSLSAARFGEVNGSSTSSAPPSRQVPSYFRTTKSSRLKTLSAGNLLKTAEVQSNKSSGLQGSKIDGGKKRAGKGRLSSSRLMMYASTPNLAHFQEDDEDMKDATEPEAEPASNLRSLADLSLSVPDINCLDDPAASTDSSSSSSGPTRRDKERSSSALQMSRTYSPSRRSLPPGGLGGKDLRFSLAQQDGDIADTNLMPPPAPTMRPAQSSLLRRAGQVRKRSTSELTLEQAKSILLGNSGILGSQNSPEEEQTPTSDHPPSARPSVNSTSSRLSQRTLSSASSSTLRPVSSRTNSSSSRTNSTSSPVFNTSNPSGYTPATTLAVAEEIDRTANELKRERQRAAAAALNASRYDPPERDQPSPQPRKQQESAPSSAAHVSFDEAGSRDDSASGASSGGEESLNLSVRERIARLNHHTPKNGSGEAGRGSLESVRSPSPSVVPPAGGRVSTPPVPPEQQVSPRSQSDTGLGSDTDTDSELRQYQEGKQGGEGAGSRGDRSRLSLHLHNSTTPSPTPPSSAASSQEAMLACTRVVADLKSAVQNAKDFHSELNSSSKATSSSHQQMMSIMAEAFHEAHVTLAQLALQSPVANDSDNLKPPSCPLVADSGSGSWNTSVMDKAKDMLQPLMSQLSRELSDELVKVVRDRLEKGGAPR